MASELRVNTLKDAAGNNSIATSMVSNGTARAWINFNMSGQSITDSFAFSSIADVDTGRFNCTMSTALANATYTVASDSTYVSGACNAVCLRDDQLTRTTTAYQMYSSQSNAGSATDCTSVMNQICGDLA
jgi:hypothetical protein